MRSLGQEGDQNMGRSRTIIKTNHGSDHQYFGDKDHNGRLCDFILARQSRIRNIDNRPAPGCMIQMIQVYKTANL